MPRTTRLALGLLAVGWLGLTAAALGIAATPAEWCSEAPPEPSGQLAFHVGLVAAGIALGLSFVPSIASERLRGWVLVAWIALVIAVFVVVLLARYFAAGGNYCG